MLLEAGAWTWADGYHAPTVLSFNIVLPAMYVLHLVTMEEFVDQDPICLNLFALAYRSSNRGGAISCRECLFYEIFFFPIAK